MGFAVPVPCFQVATYIPALSVGLIGPAAPAMQQKLHCVRPTVCNMWPGDWNPRVTNLPQCSAFIPLMIEPILFDVSLE